MRIYKLILLAAIFCVGSQQMKGKVTLPKILSNGMVLQRERPIKIWGKADEAEKVVLTFKNNKYTTKADSEGRWQIMLPAMKAGGPFEMDINEVHLNDILIGDVWLCSGQSNMELPTARCRDLYAKEIASYENSMIHYVKTPLGNDLHGAKDDFPTITWMTLTKENAPFFSAVAYFFAKQMYQNTKVPIGIINSSWGGSAVEAWISEEGLKNFPRLLNERYIYNSDEYKKLCSEAGNMMYQRWNDALYNADAGVHLPNVWYSPTFDDSDWKVVDQFSSSWPTRNEYPVNGSHWFRQHINLSEEQTSQDAELRIGTIVDADSVYFNGILVGTTAYQYPPRIYKVPKELLKSGDNQITVRMISYNGLPHFVADKRYCLISGSDTIKLSSSWRYKLGTEMPQRIDGVSFQNIPTGMYNSMIAPLKGLSFKGAIWYQGETNTGRPNEYEALLSTMISDWRSKLSDDHLHFTIVQLANFMQNHTYPAESGWAGLREAQRQVSLKVPNTDLAVAIDLGEWNDIHPQNKKELARRISLIEMNRLYGQTNVVCEGPVCSSVVIDGSKAILSFKEGTNHFQKVNKLNGFSVAGADRIFHWAETDMCNNNTISVWSKDVKNPIIVRYAWDDNPKDVNLKNKEGLPASPFEVFSRK